MPRDPKDILKSYKYKVDKDGIIIYGDFVFNGNGWGGTLPFKIKDVQETDTEYGNLRLVFINNFINCPKKIDGDLLLDNCVLKDFKGCPVTGMDYMIGKNSHLDNFVGMPTKISGSIYADGTTITSLQGSPKEVGGSFLVGSTQITSLVGGPETVGFNNPSPKGGGTLYDISNCYDLTSFEGAPKQIKGTFCFDYCKNIKSLTGIPEATNYSYKGTNFTEEDMRQFTEVEKIAKELASSGTENADAFADVFRDFNNF